jgi:hypothetical protein
LARTANPQPLQCHADPSFPPCTTHLLTHCASAMRPAGSGSIHLEPSLTCRRKRFNSRPDRFTCCQRQQPMHRNRIHPKKDPNERIRIRREFRRVAALPKRSVQRGRLQPGLQNRLTKSVLRMVGCREVASSRLSPPLLPLSSVEVQTG